MIKKEKGKWILYSKDGKKFLGAFLTKKAAIKREKQINYFVYLNKLKKQGKYNPKYKTNNKTTTKKNNKIIFL